jgi:predicted methyltransferase
MRSTRIVAAGFAAMTIAIAAIAFAKDDALAKIIASPQRSAAFVARDRYRHPQEELEFFGLKPQWTVVELVPGGGYWTEILAPYLREHGTYYTAISPRESSDRAAKSWDEWQKKLDADKATFGNVKISELGKTTYNIAPAGSADLVVTFRNVHNFMASDVTDKVLAEIYRVLKPGGILGVEDHRASDSKPQDPKAENGYVRQDYMIELAKKAGFKFIAASDINANPKDTKDYAKGVWTLPPVLASGDQDKEKYLAIGEADNFVLKFQKPK